MADDDTTTTTKYHQVAVPDHPVGSPTIGNTFVRMGSFPATSDPAAPPASFQKSLAMASLTSASRTGTGGHWSHSDGNRVTTTVGNVVDVIQGSYVGYRSAAASPPGPTLSCTWASTSYTQVGSEESPVGWANGAWTTAPTDPAGSSASTENVAYATVTAAIQAGTQVTGASAASATDTTVDSNLPAAGDVVSATWAARVISYVGSSTTRVPYVYSSTFACKVTSSTDTTGDNTTLTNANGGTVSSKTTVTNGDNNSTVTVTGGKVMSNTEADTITTLQTAATITNVNTAANNFNFTFGLQESINVGAAATVYLGAVANINIGAIANVNLGVQTNVNLPEHLQFVGNKTQAAVDAETLATTSTSILGEAAKLYATKTDLGSTDQKIVDAKTSIANLETRVNNDWNVICNIGTLSGAVIMLGP
jgi:hypothetical protein